MQVSVSYQVPPGHPMGYFEALVGSTFTDLCFALSRRHVLTLRRFSSAEEKDRQWRKNQQYLVTLPRECTYTIGEYDHLCEQWDGFVLAAFSYANPLEIVRLTDADLLSVAFYTPSSSPFCSVSLYPVHITLEVVDLEELMTFLLASHHHVSDVLWRDFATMHSSFREGKHMSLPNSEVAATV